MNEALKDEKIKRMRQQLASYKMLELVQEQLVPFQQSSRGGKKLTPEMKGYNEALSEVLRRRVAVYKWFEDLLPNLREDVTSLVMSERLEIDVSFDGHIKKIVLWLDMQSVFQEENMSVYEVPLEEIPLLASMHQRWKWPGMVAFVCHRRGVLPTDRDRFSKEFPDFEQALVDIGRH